MHLKYFYVNMFIFLITILLFLPIAQANKIYEGIGEYHLKIGFGSPEVAKERARAHAEQNAREKAGVYIQSYSKINKSRLLEDEILAVSVGILKVKNVEYSSQPSFDGKSVVYTAKIKAEMDIDYFNKFIEKDLQERTTLIERVKELQRLMQEQDKKIDNLNEQLSYIKNQQEADKLKQKFSNEDNVFLSNKEYEAALIIYFKSNYTDDLSIAISLCDKAIKLNPNNAKAYNLRADIYGRTKRDYNQSIVDNTRAIEIEPDFAEAYGDRAANYVMLEKYNQAIADYNRAIQLKKFYSTAYMGRGVAYQFLKNYDQAMSDFNEAIRLESNNSNIYFLRAGLYVSLENYNKAILDYSRAIEISPNYVRAYSNRAVTYAGLKNYSKAITDADKAIQIAPNNAECYEARAIIYMAMNKYKKARQDLNRAKELRGNN